MAIMAQATSHAPATARPPRVCTLVPFILQEPVRGIRDRLYGFVQLAFPTHQIDGDKNYQTMAMDISFGSTGYALTLARAFHNASFY